jgi:hypothetical protein
MQEANMMTHSGYLQFAEALVFAQGPKAEAEAAKHAILCEKSGDMETAETWRNVKYALKMRGLQESRLGRIAFAIRGLKGFVRPHDGQAD